MGHLKEIIWDEESEPDGKTVYYNQIIGTHPIGEFLITWKDYPTYDLEFDNEFYPAHSVAHAKEFSTELVRNKILEMKKLIQACFID